MPLTAREGATRAMLGRKSNVGWSRRRRQGFARGLCGLGLALLALSVAAPTRSKAQIVQRPIPEAPVAVESGSVSGELLDSGVRADFGVPFARWPVRELRWREPLPALTLERRLPCGSQGAGMHPGVATSRPSIITSAKRRPACYRLDRNIWASGDREARSEAAGCRLYLRAAASRSGLAGWRCTRRRKPRLRRASCSSNSRLRVGSLPASRASRTDVRIRRITPQATTASSTRSPRSSGSSARSTSSGGDPDKCPDLRPTVGLGVGVGAGGVQLARQGFVPARVRDEPGASSTIGCALPQTGGFRKRPACRCRRRSARPRSPTCGRFPPTRFWPCRRIANSDAREPYRSCRRSTATFCRRTSRPSSPPASRTMFPRWSASPATKA